MMVGKEFGPFLIEKELGTGAMGAVYQAKYLKNNARVAIKIMSPGVSSSANSSLVARFEREAEILKHLNQPNIVRLFGIGKFNNMRYYAMELIEGETLEKILQHKGRLAWDEVVEIGKQICAALQHAHDNGVVHRDLKLSNLMINKQGVLKLTDFGIAKDLEGTMLTSANTAIGTAAYMSPEQCKGERDISHKSDLYSLGVVLFELLTGRRPFRGDNAMELFLHHVQTKPEKPSRIEMDIPKWMDTLVLHLLEKKPDQRPPSAYTVSNILDEIRQKVSTQVSVGEDLAKSQVGDGYMTKTTERRKARKLLSKFSKNKTVVPWFRSGWFVLMACFLLIGAFSYTMYEIFIRPPSAEKLFKQAKSMMDQGKKDEAREGPLTLFAQYYAGSEDPQGKQMKQWTDSIDVEYGEDLLRKYLKQTAKGYKFGVQEEVEGKAFKAIELEAAGDLAESMQAWSAIGREYPKTRWAALANNRVQFMNYLDTFENEWRSVLKAIRDNRKEPELEKDLSPVFLAFRTEQFGDLALALSRYKAAKEKLEKDTDRNCIFDRNLRLPHLLCCRKIKNLAPLVKGDPEATRNDLIGKAIQSAKNPVSILDSRFACRNVVVIYEDQAGLKKLMDEASALTGKLDNELTEATKPGGKENDAKK